MEDGKDTVTKTLDNVPKILRLMDTFTFWKIFICVIGCIMGLLMVGFWENRELIITQILTTTKRPPVWEVSDITKKVIQEEVDRNTNVVWIIVTEMDLGSNLRNFKYWYNENQDVMNSQLLNLQQHGRGRQIFDFDSSHTAQMVGLLQNEFICGRANSMESDGLATNIAGQSEYVCKIAIPPFYGRFVGVLTVGVKGPLTDEVKFNVKSIAANIATTIYWRDVIKLPR